MSNSQVKNTNIQDQFHQKSIDLIMLNSILNC